MIYGRQKAGFRVTHRQTGTSVFVGAEPRGRRMSESRKLAIDIVRATVRHGPQPTGRVRSYMLGGPWVVKDATGKPLVTGEADVYAVLDRGEIERVRPAPPAGRAGG